MLDPKLVAKYWEGATTLEEENLLRIQARQDTSPEADYFRHLASLQSMRSTLKASDITGQVSTPVVRPLYRYIAAAAAVLVLVLSGIGLFRYSQEIHTPVATSETFESPEEALEEVKLALAFVSQKMNHSQSTAYTQIQKASEYADWFNH